MFAFTNYSKLYYILSGILVIASVTALAVFGLNFGIEFKGGSTLGGEFSQARPENSVITQELSEFDLGEIIVQPTGEKGIILKFKQVSEEQHSQIVEKLNEISPFNEGGFQYVGPSVGRELRIKAILASALTLLAITLYIALAFRKVSRPVASYKYGLVALAALFHDGLITLGAFSVLGWLWGAEITIPIVAALLTIIGYSVHDTIVIFDRIRENITKPTGELFSETVDKSLNQTLGRSLTTTATILLVMLALFFFGGSTLQYFSLALIIGITVGTYSSIFIAGPLLATWFRWRSYRESSYKNL